MAKDLKTKADIDKYFDDLRSCLHEMIVKQLLKTGDEAVTIAREPHAGDWTDRSGNLRSSIGFMVTYNGKEVKTGGFFPTDAPEGNGAEGQAEGRRVIDGLKGNAEGYALVIVAGMNYAEYVQSLDNYDVLGTAELEARKIVKENLSIVPQLVEQEMKKKGWK